MKIALPVHPSKRHPLTGEPIRAVYVDRRGRARYPIMGGAPDDPPADPPQDPPADPPADPPPADPPTGFPAGTPVKDMTVEQRAAYHEHQARKHEQRNKDLLAITGGKHGPDLQAELAELARLREAGLTDSERAVADAKRAGRTEAALDTARMAFEFALGHDPETNDQSDLIDTLALEKVLTDDGKVDTAKVRSIAAKIAPADKGTGGGSHDYGAGRRGGTPKSGVSAGRELYDSRKK